MATVTSLGYSISTRYDGKGVRGAKRDLTSLSTRMRRVGDSMTHTGRRLTTAVTLPILAAGAASVKMATDFDREMGKIGGLVGVSQKQLGEWSGQVVDMATQFGKSGNEAAEALFFITSAGLEGSDAMDALEVSLKASAVGLGETKVVADLVTSSMNAYKGEGLTAADATDILTAAVREGKLESDALAGSMGRILPIAASMGVGLDEVGAAMAAMSRTGTDAETATTQLRAILTSILKPASQSEEALKEMGLSSKGLQDQLEKEGLLSVLQTLDERFDGNRATMAKVFPNVRALSGFMDLMGQNAGSTEEIFGELENSTGALGDAFGVVAETDAFKMEKALATIKNLGLQIGQILLPIIGDIAEKANPLIEKFGNLDGRTQKVIVGIAGIAAAAGPLLIVTGSLVKAFGTLAGSGAMGAIISKSPLAALGIAGIGIAAGIALIQNEEFRDALVPIWEDIVQWWTGENKDTMTDAWAAGMGTMEEDTEGFQDTVESIFESLKDIVLGEKPEVTDAWASTLGSMEQNTQESTIRSDLDGQMAGMQEDTEQRHDGILTTISNFFLDWQSLTDENSREVTTWQEALSQDLDTVMDNFSNLGKVVDELLQGDIAGAFAVGDEGLGPLGQFFVDLDKNLQDSEQSLLEWGESVGENWKGAVSDIASTEWNWEETPFKRSMDGLGEFFTGWLDQKKEDWKGAWQELRDTEFEWEEMPIVKAFQDLYDWLVGNSIVPEMVGLVLFHFGRLETEGVGPFSRFRAGLESVWTGIKDTVLQPMADWLQTHLPNTSETFKSLVSGDWSGASASLGATFSELREVTLQPLADWFQTHLPNTSETFKSLVSGDWRGARANLGATFSELREFALQPLADWFETHLPNTSQSLKTLVTGDWEDVGKNITGVWNGLHSDAFRNMADWMETHLPNTSESLKNLVTGDWKDLFKNVGDLWKSVKQDVFQNIADWAEKHLPTSFQRGVDAIGNNFKKIEQLTRKPVDWVIRNVFNAGIVPLWNAVAGQTDLSKIDTMKGLARGGLLPGQSSYRDGDSMLVPMRPGEGVYVSEAMRDPYERARLFAVNRAAMRGSDLSQFRDGFAGGGMARPDMSTHDFAALAAGEGFSHGGMLGWVKDFVQKPWAEIEGNSAWWAARAFSPIWSEMLKELGPGIWRSRGTDILSDAKWSDVGPVVAGDVRDAFLARLKDFDILRHLQEGGGAIQPFGSFTFNGRSKNLPGLRGTKTHVRRIGNFIASMFGVDTAYGLGGPPEHSTGRAIDYMVGTGSGQRRGDGIAAYYLKHQKALGLRWLIWRQQIYNVAKKNWRMMEDRGNPTQNHFDHPHVFHNVRAPGHAAFIRKQKGKKFTDAGVLDGSGGGGSGSTVMTSFWDAFQPMANGRRMHGSAIASSVIPLGTKLRVNIGGKSATGSVDDLGPSSFVYRRHHPKAVLDLAEPMMERLTGRRSNVTNGSFQVLSRGSGRTLFGYTNWSGRFSPGRGTNGFAEGGIGGYEDGTDFVPRDDVYYLHRGEQVVPAAENSGHSGGGGEIHLHFHGPVSSKQAATDMVVDGMREAERKGILPKGSVRR